MGYTVPKTTAPSLNRKARRQMGQEMRRVFRRAYRRRAGRAQIQNTDDAAEAEVDSSCSLDAE